MISSNKANMRRTQLTIMSLIVQGKWFSLLLLEETEN